MLTSATEAVGSPAESCSHGGERCGVLAGRLLGPVPPRRYLLASVVSSDGRSAATSSGYGPADDPIEGGDSDGLIEEHEALTGLRADLGDGKPQEEVR
jgi:hypothetical protein